MGMKHIGTKLSIVLATSLLSTSAFALKVKPPADEPTFRQQVLAANDADRDGRLSDAEFKAMQAANQQARAAEQAKLLRRYDVNGNGKLDKAEQARVQADRRARLLPEFDTNKNGTLDKVERKEMIVERLQHKIGRRFVMMVLRFDANRDNKLQASELAGKGKGQAKKFAAIDTDRDGGIDRGEFVAHATKAQKAKLAKQAKRSKATKQPKRIGNVKAAKLIKKQGHTL
jgi:Ca2+-binding EF-hand superfamily protein